MHTPINSHRIPVGRGCEYYWQHIARCRELMMVLVLLPPPRKMGRIQGRIFFTRATSHKRHSLIFQGKLMMIFDLELLLILVASVSSGLIYYSVFCSLTM